MDTKLWNRLLGVFGVLFGVVILITTLQLTETIGVGAVWVLMLLLGVACVWMGITGLRYKPKVLVEPSDKVQALHRLGVARIKSAGVGANVLGDRTRWWFGQILTPVHFQVHGRNLTLTLSAGPNALGEHRVFDNTEALPADVVSAANQLRHVFPNPKFIVERSGQRLRLKVILHSDQECMLYLEDEFFHEQYGANFSLF